MPHRAFVPAPLLDVQPRVYRSFRGRQLKGLLAAGLGALAVVLTLGMQDLHAYLLTFAAALPGFLYGYYQPQGRPFEFWLMVHVRYLTKARLWTSAPTPGPLARQISSARAVVKATWYVAARRFLDRRGRRLDG